MILVKREAIFQWAKDFGQKENFDIKTLDEIKSYLWQDETETSKMLQTLYSSNKEEDKKQYSRIKDGLPRMWAQCFTSGGKKIKDIVRYNPFVLIDIDHVNVMPNMTVDTLFQKLKGDKYTKIMFKSPSMQGIKVLVELDLVDGLYPLDEIKAYHKFTYLSLLEYYHKEYNIPYNNSEFITSEEDVVKFLDKTGDNLDRCCFMITGRSGKNSYVRDHENTNFESFIQWKQSNQPKRVVNTPAPKLQISGTNSSFFEDILNKCKVNKIVICEAYEDWYKLSNLIIRNYGPKDGLSIFHEFSKLSRKYNKNDVDTQWTNSVSLYDPERAPSEKFLMKVAEEAGIKFTSSEVKIYNNFKYDESDYPYFMKDIGYKIILDELTQIKYVEEGNKLNEMTDAKQNSLLTKIFKYNKNMSDRRIKTYMNSEENIVYKNFLVEKIESLKTSDSKDFDTMLSLIKAEESSEDVKALILKWCLASLEQVLWDKFYNDGILYFKSGQGFGKSTFITKHFLSPFEKWLSEDFSFDRIDDKDNKKLLATSMFIYDSENNKMDKGGSSIIKSITSKKKISYRTVFHEYSRNYKRIASFISDSNDDAIYNDITGGRRYFVITLEEPLMTAQSEGGLKTVNYDNVWGYIYNLHLEGFKSGDIDISHISNEKSRYKSDLENAIDNIIISDLNEKMFLDEIRIAIIAELQRTGKSTNISDENIRRILKSKKIVQSKQVTRRDGLAQRWYSVKINNASIYKEVSRINYN
jgi:hypothetical protein